MTNSPGSIPGGYNDQERLLYFIVEEKKMRVDRNLAFILLAVYLILAGLAALGLGAQALRIIMGICALLAGIIFLINRSPA